MYCPNCGNPQSSGEIQFCPSCGFALNAVRRLVASGGEPAAPVAVEPEGKRSPRRRGINQGIMLMLFAIVIVPMIGINENARDAATAAVFFFGIAIARIIYAMLIQSNGEAQPKPDGAPVYVPPAVVRASLAHGSPRNAALPASTAARVSSPPPRTTGQLVTPPSVTEHTTRLLDTERRS